MTSIYKKLDKDNAALLLVADLTKMVDMSQ
jgi:hypothetical protein